MLDNTEYVSPCLRILFQIKRHQLAWSTKWVSRWTDYDGHKQLWLKEDRTFVITITWNHAIITITLMVHLAWFSNNISEFIVIIILIIYCDFQKRPEMIIWITWTQQVEELEFMLLWLNEFMKKSDEPKPGKMP